MRKLRGRIFKSHNYISKNKNILVFSLLSISLYSHHYHAIFNQSCIVCPSCDPSFPKQIPLLLLQYSTIYTRLFAMSAFWLKTYFAHPSLSWFVFTTWSPSSFLSHHLNPSRSHIIKGQSALPQASRLIFYNANWTLLLLSVNSPSSSPSITLFIFAVEKNFMFPLSRSKSLPYPAHAEISAHEADTRPNYHNFNNLPFSARVKLLPICTALLFRRETNINARALAFPNISQLIR